MKQNETEKRGLNPAQKKSGNAVFYKHLRIFYPNVRNRTYSVR